MRLVDPCEQRVVKFWPSRPPYRGEVVLVDGARCRVLLRVGRWLLVAAAPNQEPDA